MGVLDSLEPKEVFYYFEQICSIPHPSYKEEKLSDYCVAFAKEHHLWVYQDDLKNVIIRKEATAGYEDVEPMILQGHLDMVCEKEPGRDIDFEKEGLRLLVDGDFITAEGTTLGADDGIAVAYALAILASDTISHPKLEVVFTVCEEVGMEGATGIDLSKLKGKKLLNLDSEDEGIFLAGCAGGCSAECILKTEWEKETGSAIDITVTGLTGGHSGVEIDKWRGNANVLLGRVLCEAGRSAGYGIAALEGGAKDNAIPREARARILVEAEKAELFIAEAEKAGAAIVHEFSGSDLGLRVTAVNQGEQTEEVLTEETAKKAVLLLTGLPNGIQRMSTEIAGLPETSLNLGILSLSREKLSMRYSVRSSVKTAKENMILRLETLVAYLGGSVIRTGEYPAWEYKKDSALREDMTRVYREMYGQDPVVEAIHAGVECGIFSEKIEGLDAISIGPDMTGIHTTEEKLSISSTKRVWEYILEVIKRK